VLVVAVGAPDGRVVTARDEVVTAGRDIESQPRVIDAPRRLGLPMPQEH